MNARSFPAAVIHFAIALALLLPSAAQTATITVNSPFSVDTAADGTCELGEAIRNANDSAVDTTGGDCATGSATGVTDIINFNIGGGSPPYVIMPAMALPIIDDTMIIDATTQNAPVLCGGPLNIVLDGSSLAIGNGFFIDAFTDSVTIRGFSIINFPLAGVRVDGDNSTIECNYIGIGPDGTGPPMGNTFGVVVTGGSNTIGGPAASDRNAISGNISDGIFISGITAISNDVFNNFIGLEINGTVAAPNGGIGVQLNQAGAGNEIGTFGAGNVISANSEHGVFIDSSSDSNLITANIIGLDASGSLDRGNGVSGVTVSGGDFTTIRANVISGNTGPGMSVATTGNIVIGNSIGTNIAGTAAIANSVGVEVVGGTFNGIGGGGAAERNIISGNTEDGVMVAGGATSNVTIIGNFIGVGASGITAIPNGSAGVSVQTLATGTVIGAGGPNEGNVISGNGAAGVDLGVSPGTFLIQNIIGLGADGTTLVPNGADGVVADFSGTQVGTDPSVPNVISGNAGFGVHVRSGGTNTNVLGNLIGTDSSGTLDRGNALGGVWIDGAAGVAIGPPGSGRKGADATKGFTCPPCNVISANDGPGVLVEAPGFGALFDTNYIGADINGAPTLPNLGGGVVLDSTSGSFISNLIAGNTGAGIRTLGGPGSDLALTGNRFESNTGPGIDIDTDILISLTSGDNCIAGNSAGIDNSGSAVTADDNWWGAPDGPGGAGPGSGDTISANVTVNSFLVAPPAGCIVTAPPPPPTVDALTLDVTDSVDPVAAGSSLSYTVTVTNLLPAPVTGIVVSNSTVLPAGVVIDSVMPSLGSFSSPLWTIPSLPPAGSATLVLGLSVAPSASSGVNLIRHSAMIADVGGGLTDADGDVERTSIAWVADFSISKTSVPDAVMAGAPVTYTIVASNLGPTDAAAVRIMDTFPSELVDVTWTCSGTGGATCPATGVGDIDLFLAMPARSSVTFVAMATVPVDLETGVVNTAVVIAPPGVTDPDGSNNSAGTGTDVVGPLSLLPVATLLPDATLGEAYEFTFIAAGGLAPLDIEGTGAPPGLTFVKLVLQTSAVSRSGSDLPAFLIADTGELQQMARSRPHVAPGKGDDPVSLALSGIATEAGTFPLTVAVMDSATPAQMIERDYLLEVIDPGDVGALLPDGVVGASYGGQLEAAGLPAPVNWTMSGGNLPPGLVLNATGLVNGIPAQAGEFPFSATATGLDQSTLTGDFSITVNETGLVSLTPALPNGLLNAEYTAPVLVDGGTPPYDCDFQGGNLPPGLAVDGCATTIGGTPALAGTFDFIVRAADSSAPAFILDIPLRMAIAADTPIPAGEPPELEETGDPVEVPNSGHGSPGLGLPDQSLQHIAVDAFGQQYFTGYAWNGVTYDIQIFKYDKFDRRVWQQSYDSGGHDYGYGVAISPVDQGIYISGYLLAGTQFQAVLLKYDLNGVLLWQRRTSAGQLLDAWYALAADASGVYAVGERYNGSNFDALFDKYDHTGNLLWENVRETSDTESAYAVTLLDCRIDDPGPCRLYTAGAEGVTPRGGWVAELNPNTGVILQDNSIDNSARVLALITDLDGNLLAGATDELTADWRLFNLDTSLMTNWQITYTPGDVLRSLAVDRENFVYAGGGTQVQPINALVVVFDDGGLVLDELVIDTGQNEGVNGVAIDPANRLVAIGQRSGPNGATFLVYRIYTGKAF